MAKKNNLKRTSDKKEKQESSSYSKKQIKRDLMELFQANPGKEFNPKQISSHLNIRSKKQKEKFLGVLNKLLEKGAIEEPTRGKYTYQFKTQFVEGEVDMTRKGHAYVITEESSEDVYVPANKLNSAINGDRVKVLLYAKRKGRKPEGEVTEVIKRNKTRFVGNVQLNKSYGFLVPDDRRFINVDIFLPPENLGKVKEGEKAEVKIIKWHQESSNPEGKVVKVLGKPGEHSTEMNAIIKSYGLPTKFPKKVKEEAAELSGEIPPEEEEKRRDFRGVPTFTIDPADAKDFDDGLSIRPGPQKNTWELGIHIADVTHFVKPGSALDKEAFKRATSVYLVDRVVPMLPERLSNELCSLRPDEDKMAFSAVFVLNEEGEVLDRWFGKTLIRSQKRFSYDDAQEIIESQNGPFAEEILRLNQIAHHLRRKRFAEGAISFETQEVQFELDKEDKPIRVIPLIRKDAHKLIEDFMLLANREVARLIYNKGDSISINPFVYRVHDSPEQDKLENFSKVVKRFGYDLDRKDNKSLARSFNKLLEEIEGRPEQNLLQSLAIRTMAKAFYTTKKSDHYGLAFDYYTHFTSPIRRYPDVITHRLLEGYLSEQQVMKKDEIEKQCQHSSQMEVKAEEAERASIKYKQVEYLGHYVGEEFEGIINGVIEKGFFVELSENKCEGMVPIQYLLDDFYYLDESNYRLIGSHKGKTFQLGDLVKVRILETNLERRTVTMDLIEQLD